MYTVQSYPITKLTSPNFHNIVPPENILWLSFDPITTTFASLLFQWLGGTVTPFSFEIDITHHHISSFMPQLISPTYTTLSYLLYHLHLFKGLTPLPSSSSSSSNNVSCVVDNVTQACKSIASHDATHACKITACIDATQACKTIAILMLRRYVK